MKQTQVIDPIRHKAANPKSPSPEEEWAFWLVILSVELRDSNPQNRSFVGRWSGSVICRIRVPGTDEACMMTSCRQGHIRGVCASPVGLVVSLL